MYSPPSHMLEDGYICLGGGVGEYFCTKQITEKTFTGCVSQSIVATVSPHRAVALSRHTLILRSRPHNSLDNTG